LGTRVCSIRGSPALLITKEACPASDSLASQVQCVGQHKFHQEENYDEVDADEVDDDDDSDHVDAESDFKPPGDGQRDASSVPGMCI
jgi:hypothetical protein